MANTPHFSPVRQKASSEEAAISQALMMVGATRDEVEVEVLETTEKGVTVRISPRRDSAEENSADSTAGNAQNATETTAETATVIETPVAKAEEEVIEVADFTDSEDFNNEESAESTAPESADELEEEAAEESAEEAAPTPPAPIVAREAEPEQVQRAQELAQEFLERMDLQANVNVVPAPPAAMEDSQNDTPVIHLDIEGEDVGILIGKHGQTLQSFQYLLNLTLNNRVHETDGDESDALRVIVDAGGYRLRRAQSLDQAARNAASRAKRDRRAIRLEPMSAQERRLVHIALRSDGEVATSSEGREPHRYVVITPANNSGGSGGNQGGQNRRGPRRQPQYGSNSASYGGGSSRRGER